MDVAAFTPEQGREILEAVRMLKGSALMSQDGQKRPNYSLERHVYYFKNEDEQEAIPFACLQVVGTEVGLNNRTYLKVKRPADTTSDAGHYIFNGVNAVPSGELGNGFDGPLVRMASDETDFEAGDLFQPIVDSWKVEKGGSNFIAAGVDDIRDDVIRGFIGASGGGGCELMIVTIDEIYETGEASSDHCDDQLNDAKKQYKATCVKSCCGGKPSGANEDGTYTIHDHHFQMLQGGIGGAREEADVIGKEALVIRMIECEPYDDECEWNILFINWFRTVQVVTNVIMTEEQLKFEMKNVEVWDDCELDPIVIPLIDCEDDYYNG